MARSDVRFSASLSRRYAHPFRFHVRLAKRATSSGYFLARGTCNHPTAV